MLPPSLELGGVAAFAAIRVEAFGETFRESSVFNRPFLGNFAIIRLTLAFRCLALAFPSAFIEPFWGRLVLGLGAEFLPAFWLDALLGRPSVGAILVHVAGVLPLYKSIR